MASHRWRPVIFSSVAVLVIWALAITGFMLAKNSRMTADKVREFTESVDLRKLSASERAHAIRNLADKFNALPAEERRRAQLERVASGQLAQMTEEEKSRFIEETTPSGFKQMLTAFEQLPEDKRRRTVEDALRRIREAQIKIRAEDGNVAETNALPQITRELQGKIRTLGLAEFYSQSSAQTKAELAPVLEELQRVMESGRPFRGKIIMIELRNVRKCFGDNVAVEDLSLQVPPREIYGLLGHNGAGKSTAIGMMLGQVWPTRGEVRICGFDVTSQRRKALHKVGAIFESPAFYDYLSGWANLEILSSYTAPTPKRRLQEVIEWVGLTGRERSSVRTYSHGMRARLALAQALLPQPDLLILDEPSDGLDPEGIHEMRLTILRLHRELGLTILLSSHFLSEVEQLCTRIAVMNRGRKVFEGTLADTKQREQWVRLKTGDFTAAASAMRQAGLITDQRDGHFIVLSKGTGSEQVVQFLVERGMPVYEITREEETLESFYLSLMQKSK